LYTAQKATVTMRCSPTQTKVSFISVLNCTSQIYHNAERSRDTVQQRKNSCLRDEFVIHIHIDTYV